MMMVANNTTRQFQKFTFNLAKGTARLRRENLNGRQHMVVPTVMLGEGVHTGTQGPIYYATNENAKSVTDWNHMPAVLYHPTDKNGAPTSAREPTVLNTRQVGVILNTTCDSVGKLSTEAWLDEERLKAVDIRVYNALEAGEKVEVSTGLWLELEAGEGEWNGQKYVGKAKNYKPDHLAILPDRVGAFSIEKGGGLLANEQNEPESTRLGLRRAVEKALLPLGISLTANEMSFSAITRTLNDLLSTRFGQPGKYWDGTICEVFTDRVVYYDSGYQLYMLGYTASDAGVELASGDPVAVTRVIEYQTADGKSYVGNTQGTMTETQKRGDSMFDKKAHITALIGNGQLLEADRAKYEALPDDVVKGILIVQKQTNNQAPAVPPTTVQVGNNTPQTMDQWLASAPPEIRDTLSESVAVANQAKEGYIKAILATPGNEFPEATLRSYPLNNLRAMAKLAGQNPMNGGTLTGNGYGGLHVPIPQNYAGQVGANVQNVGNGTPVPGPGVVPAPGQQYTPQALSLPSLNATEQKK